MSKWKLHASSSAAEAEAEAEAEVGVPPSSRLSSADTDQFNNGGEYPKRSGPGAVQAFSPHPHPHPPDEDDAVQNPEMLTPAGRLLPRCVDSGFLDGASSSARVGLDIGGTLCKVVYFEPDVDLLINVDSASKDKKKLGQQQQHYHLREESYSSFAKGSRGLSDEAESARSSAHSPKVVSGKGRNGYHSERETTEGSAFCLKENEGEGYNNDVKLIDAAGGVDKSMPLLDSNIAAAADADGFVKRQGLDNNWNERGTWWATATATATGGMVSSESCQCSCGPGPPGVQGPDFKNQDGRMFAGVESDQKTRAQLQKIWVSSHEPVYLSGRGTLYFKCFETYQMEEFLNLTKDYHLMTAGQAIGATGGGARKFSDSFLEIAGLNLQRADELKSLVRGIDFLVRNAHHENFEYPSGAYQGGSIQRPLASPEDSSDEGSDNVCKDEISVNLRKASSETSFRILENGQPESHNKAPNSSGTKLMMPVIARLDSGMWTGSSEPLHPYLVVNIGSGVSILRVESPDVFERVGGTSLGGSTFLGLAKALTGCQSFEEALSLASQGDSTNVDMLVGDIYGGDYTEMGLAATTVASSFGKLVQPRQNMEAQQPQHLAKATLLMVTNNIGSIAWLHARDVHSVMFTGSFLHNNQLAMRLLAVAMEFWSKGKMKAVFLRHEGHAGAMGALLSSLESSNPLDALLLS